MSADLTGASDVTTVDDDPELDALEVEEAEVADDERGDEVDELAPDDVDTDEAEPDDTVTVFAPGAEAATPVARPSRRDVRREVRLSARRVRRVVRRVDPWSTFKVSALFSICVWACVVLSTLLLWRAAVSAGSVDNIEGFVRDIGFKDFHFHPDDMFRALLIGGGILTVATTFFVVLGTILFNLICDLTGGVRITMIEQDTVDARRRRPRRDPLAKKKR